MTDERARKKSVYFFGGFAGPSTAGRLFKYSAMASRSDLGRAAIFFTTSAMEDPTLSKSGVKPEASKSETSDFDHEPKPLAVMFGTQPRPSASGPPA